MAGCGGGGAGQQPSSSAGALDRGRGLQTLLETERAAYGARGALAVVRVGDRRWAGVSGTADVRGARLAADSTFRIASITKPLVAALVLDAVDRGELSLGDAVEAHLPGVLRDGRAVTVRMLLNHTSGVFDEGNEGDPRADAARLTDPALVGEAQQIARRYDAGERVIAPDRLLVALAETHDRYFAPGTAYHYSNINDQLAAMVLEKVTGRPVADLLRTGLVEPLGLRHTTLAPPDLRAPAMRGYVRAAGTGAPVDVTDDVLAFGNGGNGGVVSTADELLSMLQAVVAGRLFPPALVTDMLTPAEGNYGLGMSTYTTRCGTFHGHQGAVNGTGSIAWVSADGRNGVVIAQNLISDVEADLPALAEDLVCTAVT